MVDALHLGVSRKLGVEVEEDRHVDRLARPQALLLHARGGGDSGGGGRVAAAAAAVMLATRQGQQAKCAAGVQSFSTSAYSGAQTVLRWLTPRLTSKQKHWILLKYCPTCIGATLYVETPTHTQASRPAGRHPGHHRMLLQQQRTAHHAAHRHRARRHTRARPPSSPVTALSLLLCAV